MKKISTILLVAVLLLTVQGCKGNSVVKGEPLSGTDFETDTTDPIDYHFETGNLNWIDEVQTYCMLPVIPEDAQKLNASVNGLWGGMGGSNSIITASNTIPAVQASYEDDAMGFVNQCHAHKLYSVGMVNGVEGFHALEEKFPNLDEMACRDWQGQIEIDGEEPDELTTTMCNNNPAWFQVQLQMGKAAIDAGVDLLNQDTPYGTAMLSGFGAMGMCEHCMAMFEKCLHTQYTQHELVSLFNLVQFNGDVVRQRLFPFQMTTLPEESPFLKDTPDALLFQAFIRCHEQAAYDQRAEMVAKLREYAAARGRQVAFTLNAAHLGSANPGNNWIRTLMFANLVDFFTYEQDVLPDGNILKFEPTPLPRGKWAPYHKLAYAIHHRRAPAVLSAIPMSSLLAGVISEGKTYNSWMGILAAEAYAANGAFTQFHVDPLPESYNFFDTIWKDSATIFKYVLKNRFLFSGSLQSGSPLAIVMLHSDQGRTLRAVFPSFLGFSTAFTDGGIAYDVIFDGDGHFVADKLTATDVAAYETLLVPSPIAPTEKQQQILREFVQQGGTIVCQEPEKLGISAPAEVTGAESMSAISYQFPYGGGNILVLQAEATIGSTGDVGAKYFIDYSSADRNRIWELAAALGHHPIVDEAHQIHIGTFPVAQPEESRMVVHFVNYNINTQKDTVIAAQNIPFHIHLADFLPSPKTALWHAPGDSAPTSVDFTVSNGIASGTISKLSVLGSLVLR